MTESLSHSHASAQPAVFGPSRGERISLRLIQAGTFTIVPAVAILHVFELDRFFVPKELVLHLTAALAGMFGLGALRRVQLSRADLLLVVFLAISAASALLAPNPWLAFRAVAVSASGIVVFWLARGLSAAELRRPLVNGMALAIFAIAATALLQAYGIQTLLFSENRVPGGALGNRNFVAHAAAFGSPVVIFAALIARRITGYLFWCVAAGAVTAALVLTRSRAGWLAFGGALAVILIAMILAPSLRRDAKTWRGLVGIILFAAAGVAAALYLPNTLRWRSGNPYLESMQRMIDYQEGSGRGRLVQYEHSLRMTLRHPLLGVGPGNWAVVYPDHAARRDPSLDRSEAGMTSNPWPSSDWVAFVSERGPLAALILGLAILMIVGNALDGMRGAGDSEAAFRQAAVIATLVAAGIAGAFDAVLLLALPSLLVWGIAGALWSGTPQPVVSRTRTLPRLLFVVLILVSAAGIFRSASQLVGMHLYANRTDRSSMILAARIDPGNYRVRLRLARSGPRRTRCEHARAAHALYPEAAAARQLHRRCD